MSKILLGTPSKFGHSAIQTQQPFLSKVDYYKIPQQHAPSAKHRDTEGPYHPANSMHFELPSTAIGLTMRLVLVTSRHV